MLSARNHPPMFSSCPALKNQLVDFYEYVGYSTVLGLVNSPNSVDNTLTFNLAGTGVNFGTDWSQCAVCSAVQKGLSAVVCYSYILLSLQTACSLNTRCAAYTAFTNPSDLLWFGQCYGRSRALSVLAPVTDSTLRRFEHVASLVYMCCGRALDWCLFAVVCAQQHVNVSVCLRLCPLEP